LNEYEIAWLIADRAILFAGDIRLRKSISFLIGMQKKRTLYINWRLERNRINTTGNSSFTGHLITCNRIEFFLNQLSLYPFPDPAQGRIGDTREGSDMIGRNTIDDIGMFVQL